MKKNLVILFLLLTGRIICVNAQSIPFPLPGHEGLNVKDLIRFDVDDSKSLNIGLWVQDRIMYNISNIPGPGGTSFDNTINYDFFRQRFRTGIDIRLTDSEGMSKAGVYTQLEYRGGWGGSSPMQSDPRGLDPVNNPYNRLQSRGIRYGFVYYNHNENLHISAGIIPLTDRVGRILFDADWDFNVGGLTMGGKVMEGSYRLAYVRLIEGVGAGSGNPIGLNSHLFLGDFNRSFTSSFEAGLHIYGLSIPESFNIDPTKFELWYGFTATVNFQPITINGFLLLNNGNIAGETHNGMAIKLEGFTEINKTKLSIQGIYASGDEENEINNRFVTVHQLVGTGGYWGYMHVFTPNGPSDVNDLGLEIGNNGAGLTTIQAKVDFPLGMSKLNGQLFGGWFHANKERNNNKNMGTEIGGMLSYQFVKYLTLEMGGAYVITDEFFSNNPDKLFEIFSRFQFTW